MTRDDIKYWLRHPVTAWMMKELAEKFRLEDAWYYGSDSSIERLKGRRDVFEAIKSLCEPDDTPAPDDGGR